MTALDARPSLPRWLVVVPVGRNGGGRDGGAADPDPHGRRIPYRSGRPQSGDRAADRPRHRGAALAIILAIALPSTAPKVRSNYVALLASSLRLFATESELRRSCLYQALLFGGFSAAWTSVALLLTGSPYRYGTGVVGFVALVGAASVFLVPVAGRVVARRGPDIVSLACILGVGVAAIILLAGALGGFGGLAGLIIGLLVLDVSMQSSQIANQARIFALRPDARSRLNSMYMTCVFLGGAAGSAIGSLLFVSIGWPAVCAFILAVAVVGLVRHLLHGSAEPAEPLAGES